jgi:translocation and assembly module TamB
MAAPDTNPQPPPLPRRRRHAWRALAASLVLALLVAASLWGLLRSEAGTAWWLARLPGTTVSGVRGALLADRLEVDSLRWQGSAGSVAIDSLVLTGLRWQWRPASGLWLGGWTADTVRAERAVWTSRPSDTPATLPVSLEWPLQLTLPIEVGTLQIDSLPPLTALALTLQVGADGGAHHRIDGLRLQWDRLRASGQAQLDATRPYALSAALTLRSLDGAATPWQAQLGADGKLDQMQLTATLRGTDHTAVDLRALLQPLAPWPIDAVSASTRALNLATLSSRWPETRLDVQATLKAPARDQPVAATLTLSNALPGRWNEGRLPLRQATLTLGARLDRRGTVDIQAFDLQLADAGGNAGRLQGRGQWQEHGLKLDTTLTQLAPQRLDGRAAAMTLSGPLQLQLQGLPSPDASDTSKVLAFGLALQARLDGRLAAAPQPVQLTLDLAGDADDWQLRTLRAQAGGARADLSARLQRRDAGWALDSRGSLAEFDPVLWWPGVEGGAWRRGPHRLNAQWELALGLPADAATLAPATLLQRATGQARLQVEHSQLAGLPLAADLQLAPADGGSLKGWADLAGNRLQVDGQGASDVWQVDLQAPALAALAPLAVLVPALAPWSPKAGQAVASATLHGRWPAVQGQGTARLTALQAGPLALDGATLQWQGGVAADAPLKALLEADNVRWNGHVMTALRAELEGTLAAHRLRADASLPLQAPAALEQALGLQPQRGTRLALRAEGGLAASDSGARWSGQLQALGAGGWDGKQLLAATSSTPTDWLDARALRVEIDFGRSGNLQRLRLDPGRVQLAGGLGLRWDEVRWDSEGGPWQLKAELEPVRVAPLLARWQPALGWDGDLLVGARIDVRAGAQMDADIVLERGSGDLRVRDAAGEPLTLGLTQLRLALSAHDGIWSFTQALSGRTLGELEASLRVRTAPAARWPAADAPLDGSLQARVANLGIWGAWVPPGWRLGGSLQSSASVGGTFGAPQFRGELKASDLALRNLLQGVNLTDGAVTVRLEGDKATVEAFTLRAGDGSLKVEGGAVFGSSPSLRLALAAQGFQVLGRIDRKLVVSGRAELQLRSDALALTGRISVDEGLFDASRADAPVLDDDVVVRRADTPPADDADAAANRPRRSTDVAVDIDLGSRLRVRGRGLDTLLAGQLRLTAPAGKLAVTGTVSTVRGTYAAYGQKLEISRGLLAFSGPADNPRLDVLALRPNLDIEVGVAVTGSAQSPRVRLHSDPELSDTDKLSWLVLGRDPVGLGRTDSALLQRAAVALLAGEGEGPTDALVRNLGLDELSVRQTDGEVRETIVSLGKQLSRRWYVGYERGVNATVGTWQLIYRVAQSFTLRAQSGLENSLDLIWVWRIK